MRKLLVGLVAAVGFGVLMSACGGAPASRDGGNGAPVVKKTYACPMGCATSDAPGKCPKCGMAMTEKK